MLHEQIRHARLEAGLSQMQLARMAGIQRSLLQNLEDGRNVTIETLQKVVGCLPALRSLTLNSVELTPSVASELRHEAQQMLAAAQRILALLDGTAASPEATSPAAGATRFEGSTEVPAALQERLRDLDGALPSPAPKES